MIHNISWGSYWCALFIGLVLYYGYVLFAYYRKDILKLMSGKRSAIHSTGPAPVIERLPDTDENNDEIFPKIEMLSDEMSAYLDQQEHGVKEQVLFGLQQIFKKYKDVAGSAYRIAVERLLVFECSDKCALHLTEEEVRTVWLS